MLTMYTHMYGCMFVCTNTHNVIWFCFLSLVVDLFNRGWFNMCTFCMPWMHLWVCIYILQTMLKSTFGVFKLCTKRTVLAHLNDFTFGFCHIFPLLCFLSSIHSFCIYLHPSQWCALHIFIHAQRIFLHLQSLTVNYYLMRAFKMNKSAGIVYKCIVDKA